MESACARCPTAPSFAGKAFGDRPWFAAARSGAPGPSFRVTDEPGLGRTLKIVQPLIRGKRFAGALVGVIALAEDNLLTPALHENLPRDTDAVLVDETGQIIYPSDRARAAEGSGWAEAIAAAARGASGTLTAEANGQSALFAFSPVHAETRYAVVFSWPWRKLTANLEQQALALGGILLFGLILAAIAGVLLAGYLARPLQALASGAIRIARGEPVPAADRPRGGTEEIAALGGAFADMEKAIRQRDQELRDAAALLEQRVRDRTAELLATQAALVDAERFAAMGKTSAAIAHELKNSLNGLGMAVELIADDPAQRGARRPPAPAGHRRDRAPARRGRLAAVVLAVAAHRSRVRRSVRGDRARRRAAVRAGGRTRRGPEGECAAGVAHALRRAQGPGRGGEPGQERDRGRQTRRGHAALSTTARRSSRSPTTARACRRRRARTCSSRSSPPSRTGPGWGCRPRTASWRRTAAASRPTRRRRWAARCSACGFRWRPPTRPADKAPEAPRP